MTSTSYGTGLVRFLVDPIVCTHDMYVHVYDVCMYHVCTYTYMCAAHVAHRDLGAFDGATFCCTQMCVQVLYAVRK